MMGNHVRRGRQAKALRFTQAEQRAELRALITSAQQVAKLDAQGDRALKERARLAKKISKEGSG